MRLPPSFLAFACAALATLHATTVATMSFDEAVERSSAIVHGKVVRSWTSWDPEHTAIWTHYRIEVRDALKGARKSAITLSEPGGEIDGKRMDIVGAPRYAVGEEVVVFAALTPIGYLRTCGWGQGKFQVQASSASPSGQVVRSGASGVQLVSVRKRTGPAAASVASSDGADLEAFLARIRAAVAEKGSRGAQ
jgi:hypothetical protein